MEIIFLLGAGQAFFFALLLFGKNNASQNHKLLIAFFFLTGLVLIDHFFKQTGLVFTHPHLLGIAYTLPIILGPILYYYTKSLTNKTETKLFPQFLIHSLPFLSLTTFFIYDFYFLNSEAKLDYYLKETEGETSTIIFLAEFFLNFSVPSYSVVSLLVLSRHKKRIKQNFSNTENIDLHWLRIVLICMIIISFISLTTGYFSDYLEYFPFWVGDNILYSSLTVVIYFLGYYGIMQKIIFSNKMNEVVDINNAEPTKPKYAKSILKVEEMELYISRLKEYMKNKKPYLSENLSLQQLAGCLEIAPNKLSQVINEGLNKNFYDLTNEYRIEEIKNKISDPNYAHYSLLGLAFECGFNSKSTFNNVFKQLTGKTPSEYRKSIS
ncbi:MAG: AraC family transcriptional regulator [Bacteroidota bacterium]